MDRKAIEAFIIGIGVCLCSLSAINLYFSTDVVILIILIGAFLFFLSFSVINLYRLIKIIFFGLRALYRYLKK